MLLTHVCVHASTQTNVSINGMANSDICMSHVFLMSTTATCHRKPT